MNAIIPITFLVLSGGIFFGYIDGAYTNIKDVQAKKATYDDALVSAKRAVAKFNDLQSKYNNIPLEEVEQIKRFLPDNIDNIRLIIDINTIVQQHGMTIKGIKIDAGKSSGSTAAPVGVTAATQSLAPIAGTKSFDQGVSKESGVGTVGMSFTVTGTYENFLAFVKDMEKSLRLVDIIHVTVSSPDAGKNTSDCSVSVRTYWLK
jgi:Tfp pilus assembly protein PilO